MLFTVWELGGGHPSPMGTPQQGSSGGHFLLLFGSLFAEGTQVN